MKRGPRYDAMLQGLKTYSTGLPCKFGHFSDRKTRNGQCTECERLGKIIKYVGNRDAALERARVYREGNRKKINDSVKEYYVRNREKVLKNAKNYRTKNKDLLAQVRKEEYPTRKQYFKRIYEEQKQSILQKNKEYHRLNPHIRTAATAKRRAIKLNATPPWVDAKALVKIYKKRKAMQDELGIKMQVDHIIPLNGGDVCGLHVPWNLRVIPATDNLRKSTSYDQGDALAFTGEF